MMQTESLMDRLEIDQLCVVVRDIEKAINQLGALFDVGPFRRLEHDHPSVFHGKEMPLRFKAAFVQVGPIELEFIEPGEGESTYTEFLRQKGEGVHHLRITVSDVESELSKFRKRGIEPLQSGESPRVKFAYLDTEGVMGVILELLQRKQGD